MTTYKNIKGIEIKYLSADPPAPTIGQVWYNSTTKVVKGAINGVGAWASGGALNVKRKGIQGFGIQTAAIAVGGQGGADNSAQVLCEAYNGSSWTEVNNVNTGKTSRGNCGVQTAGLLIGGAPRTADVEEWDGTSWTETANYPAAVTDPFLCGVQTAAFAISGGEPFTTATNTYNGSAFTSSTAVNTGRSSGAASGTVSAAVIAGGTNADGTAGINNTELWNGSAWTEVNNLNTAKNLMEGSGTTSTSMIVYGGGPNLAQTEQWDGTSWTEIADLATGRQELGGSTNGSTTAALAFGGSVSGTSQTVTEEFTVTSFTTKTFDTD